MSRLMEKYLDKITRRSETLGEPTRCIVKFKGNMKYLFAMMDDETRFWIAIQVADKKGT